MRILIVTPLYPPDIAEPAPYVKELARRLSQAHTVTVLSYNHIPEAIAGVRILAVEKHLPVTVRLARFTYALIREVLHTDITLVQNGSSTEFPLLLAFWLVRVKYIFHLNDGKALRTAERNALRRVILVSVVKRADKVIVQSELQQNAHVLFGKKTPLLLMSRPEKRPEILPLEPYPVTLFERYESSWRDHIRSLSALFSK